jgi:hypothetical protein
MMMRYLGLAQRHLLGVDDEAFVTKVMDDGVPGLSVKTYGFLPRSPRTETTCLSNTNAYIPQQHMRNAGTDAAPLFTHEEDTSEPPTKPPPAKKLKHLKTDTKSPQQSDKCGRRSDQRNGRAIGHPYFHSTKDQQHREKLYKEKPPPSPRNGVSSRLARSR